MMLIGFPLIFRKYDLESMRRGFTYSRPSDFEPTVRFPSSSGFMGAVPPPLQLTIPNAATVVNDTVTKDLERKKEEQVYCWTIIFFQVI